MRDQETNRLKAQELEDSAQKRLRGGCGGDVATYKLEEAASDYEKAANFYKLAKLNEDSAKASLQAAEIYEGLEQSYSAASQFAKASKSYKMADNSKLSEHYLKLAIELWTQDGKFSMAAKATKDLAEDFEGEGVFDQAAIMYQQSADFYDNADSPSSSSSSASKAADCLAMCKKFGEASKIFLAMATSCLKRDLGKYKFDELQMKAVLCKLAEGDIVAANKLCTNFGNQTSQSRRIGLLLMDIIEAVDNNDLDDFLKNTSDSLFSSPWFTFVFDEVQKQVDEDAQPDFT
jgi:alpha-soluble NSF attachment protein